MAQELYRPNEVTASQRLSSPSNSKNTIFDPSDSYLASQFQEKFEQVAEATMQEIHRARDRSLGRIVPSQSAAHSPIGRDRVTDPTEPASPVPSGAKVKSRVIDIRKDLNIRRAFVQVAAKNPRACLDGMTGKPATIHQPVATGSQHLVIGEILVI